MVIDAIELRVFDAIKLRLSKRLSAADEVSEKDCTVYNLNMDSKECAIVT